MKEKQILIITPKDIMRIFDVSYQAAWKRMKKIRKFHGKRKEQVVTVRDFCEFIGMREEEVLHQLE